MQNELSFIDLIRQILRQNPEGLTPQQIRETMKVEYPQHVGTPILPQWTCVRARGVGAETHERAARIPP